MKMLLVYLAVMLPLVAQASVISNLQRYMDRNRILHDLLVAESCPLWESTRNRRAILNDGRASTQLEAELIYYQELTDRLIECRKENFHKLTSTFKARNPPTTATTSTAPPKIPTALPTTYTAPPTISTAPPTTSTAPPITSTAPPTTSTAPPTTSTAPPTTSTAQPSTSTAPPTTSTASPTVPELVTSAARPSGTRGPAINLALGKEIAANSQSYDLVGFGPDNIVDGIAENGTDDNCYCNADTSNPNVFITIDLGQQYRVREVKLWARPGGYFNQVADLEFRVAPTLDGFDNPASLCYYRPGRPTVRPEIFSCTQPITGRYVRTLKRTTGFLCFVELEVYE